MLCSKYLGRNPPQVRLASGKKLWTEIVYIVLETSVRLFQISSQKKSLLTTPNVENKCWSSFETLESTGEMTLMMKFYLCLHNFSELWNLFSQVPVGNCFWCYFRQLSLSLAFRKYKKDFNILNNILVQEFCPLKTWSCRFPIRLRLNSTWTHACILSLS